MADEIRALALTGMLGSGFHESSFERALSWEPAQEIARDEGLHFRLAVIHAEQDKEYLKRKRPKGGSGRWRRRRRSMTRSSTAASTSSA